MPETEIRAEHEGENDVAVGLGVRGEFDDIAGITAGADLAVAGILAEVAGNRPGGESALDDGRFDRQIDRQIADFAEANGLKYVAAGGFEKAHADFVRLLWTQPRRDMIEVVQSHLLKSNALFDGLLRDDAAAVGQIGAIIGAGISFPELIGDELEGIGLLAMSERRGRDCEGKEREDFAGVLAPLLREELCRMRTKYCYGIQYKFDVFKSVGIVPESLVPFLGMEDVHELLIKTDRRKGRVLRRVVDFGCGDGYLLRLWDGEIGGHNENVGLFQKVLPATAEIRSAADRIEMIECLRSTHHCDESDIIYGERDKRRAITGIDQSRECVADLERSRIRGRAADISAPWSEFQEATKIRTGSRDIVLTSYTLDRTHNPDRQLQNMVNACAPGGRLVIISKTELDPRGDGWQWRGGNKQRRPLYSTTDLRSADKIRLLTKLKRRMERYGCEMRSVGRHPTKVICADCNTGFGGGPQNYSSLVMVFEKVAGASRDSAA